MQRLLFGALMGTLLLVAVMVGTGLSEPTAGGRAPAISVANAPLIAHVTAVEGGPQTVTVIDPTQRVMAIYHIDKSTGEIALRSVRNLTWDLQLIDFNSGKPLPQEIRTMRGELER